MGDVRGLQYGDHALSINTDGDLTNDCKNTGSVYAPLTDAEQLAINQITKPNGQLKNLHTDMWLNSFVDAEVEFDLSGNQSLLGRSIVVSKLDEKDYSG